MRVHASPSTLEWAVPVTVPLTFVLSAALDPHHPGNAVVLHDAHGDVVATSFEIADSQARWSSPRQLARLGCGDRMAVLLDVALPRDARFSVSLRLHGPPGPDGVVPRLELDDVGFVTSGHITLREASFGTYVDRDGDGELDVEDFVGADDVARDASLRLTFSEVPDVTLQRSWQRVRLHHDVSRDGYDDADPDPYVPAAHDLVGPRVPLVPLAPLAAGERYCVAYDVSSRFGNGDVGDDRERAALCFGVAP